MQVDVQANKLTSRAGDGRERLGVGARFALRTGGHSGSGCSSSARGSSASSSFSPTLSSPPSTTASRTSTASARRTGSGSPTT